VSVFTITAEWLMRTLRTLDELGLDEVTYIGPSFQELDMIIPSIGRKVWFYPNGATVNGQPHDATIVYVWNDRLVNLACHDGNGVPYAATSVALYQEGDNALVGAYATWMPYQVGQAKAVSP
jgi:hypothetical protein